MPTSSSTAEAPSAFTDGRAHPPAARRRRGPSFSTLLVAGCWVWTRAALVVFTVMGCWLLRVDSGGRLSGPTRWFLERFTWWDSFHFLRIADRGYLSLDRGGGDQAFFPGYPLMIAAVRPLTGGNAAMAGFVVSVVAGTVAAVVLWHLGRLTTGTPRGGWVAVTMLAVAPYGFFLVTVYSEALFLACAFGAWAAGLTRRWWLAGALAGLASLVRINGLFLAVALGVLYLVQHRRRLRPDVLALALPVLAVAAYFVYLRLRTGSWNAWQQAQDIGWDRGVAAPWTGLKNGWHNMATAGTADLVISRWADLVVTVAGVLLVVVLALLRRWPETVFVLLNVAVLVCSTTLISAPRYALMWFPVYLLLAELGVRPRWRWVTPALVIACLPLLGVVALSFAAHGWTA
jgi:Mannosyltransferase (PIG-V)